MRRVAFAVASLAVAFAGSGCENMGGIVPARQTTPVPGATATMPFGPPTAASTPLATISPAPRFASPTPSGLPSPSPSASPSGPPSPSPSPSASGALSASASPSPSDAPSASTSALDAVLAS